jgi:hypothetical protein
LIEKILTEVSKLVYTSDSQHILEFKGRGGQYSCIDNILVGDVSWPDSLLLTAQTGKLASKIAGIMTVTAEITGRYWSNYKCGLRMSDSRGRREGKKNNTGRREGQRL